MRQKENRFQKLRSKYAKIPLKTKVKFLRKVVVEGMSIRDSAINYDINYSTAKTLMRQYKSDMFQYDLTLPLESCQCKQEDQEIRIRCEYKEILMDNNLKFQAISTSDSLSHSSQRKPQNSQHSGEEKPRSEQILLTRSPIQKIEVISSITFQ